MDILKIKFEDNSESYDPSSAFVAHLTSISGKKELFSKLKTELKFPDYFGNNWDALYDCLRDFYWMDEKKVVLVHDVLPKLSPSDFKTYISILNDSINSWKENENHSLEVVFHLRDKNLIEKTL